MIDEGVLENLKVDVVFGCYVWFSVKVGYIVIKDGDMMIYIILFDVIF